MAKDSPDLGSESDRGTLHVCAVPIGNLADASPRLRAVLEAVSVIACEDTRTTRGLLDRLEIAGSPRLLAHHAHNERASSAGVLELLLDGTDVALVSDAGTPSVSDPGVLLVAAAHGAGVEVVAVPGPSAVSAAVSIAGMGGDGYRFVGFLPRSEGELRELLERDAHAVVVAFESPHRIRETLRCIERAQPQRALCVCRELTKRFETALRGTAGEVQARMPDPVKGEVVLVLGALPVAEDAGEGPSDALVALVDDLAREGVRVKAAARIVAARCGGSARELFEAVHRARADADR